MATTGGDNAQPPPKRLLHDAQGDEGAAPAAAAADDNAQPQPTRLRHDAKGDEGAAADDNAQPPPKRLRHDAQGDEGAASAAAAAEPQVTRVELNPADCNLDFVIGRGGLQGRALHEGGFAYCWSGARATVGVRGGGKYCFGCRVVAEQAVEMDNTASDQRHLCRIGVSRGDDPVGSLGESSHSFGFEGTGRFSHQGTFVDYGVKFGVGDKVVCAIDLDSKPMASIVFLRNNEWLGVAKHFDASDKGLGLIGIPVRLLQWDSAIFPHVLLKNVVVEMQFSRDDGLEPVDGYEPWSSADAYGNAVSGPLFAEKRECEVMMMVGLPASGKSTWAEKWVKEHPEKRFVLIGTKLDQMKVPDLLHKHNYSEHLDKLREYAEVIFNTLLERAAKIPHNYILDQRNINKLARIRKLKPFIYFRKIAVVVFPSPSELKSRAIKHFKETWRQVPAELVDEMIGSFVLPQSKDMPGSMEPFDEVIFVELSRDNAQRTLDEMKLPSGSSPNLFQGCQSTSGSQHQSESSYSNSRDQCLIHPSSVEDKPPLDDDFVMLRNLDLLEEYEAVDSVYIKITELSKSGKTPRAEIDAAWVTFTDGMNKCKAIRREIKSHGGNAHPIPDHFLPH